MMYENQIGPDEHAPVCIVRMFCEVAKHYVRFAEALKND